MHEPINSVASVDFPVSNTNMIGELKAYERNLARINIHTGMPCMNQVPAGEPGTLTVVENCVIKKMAVDINDCNVNELLLNVLQEIYTVHRRKNKRIQWTADVLIRNHKREGGNTADWKEVKSLNISSTGIRLDIDGNADLSDMIDVKFTLKDILKKTHVNADNTPKLTIVSAADFASGTNISALGEIICEDGSAQGKKSVGIKFINLSSYAEEALNAFIQSN